MKKYGSIIMVGALVLFFTGSFLLGNAYAQYKTEEVVKAASKETVLDEREEKEEPSENLHAEKEEQKAEVLQAEVSMDLAQQILKEIPDVPLLQRNAKENFGDSSLENMINDVNAAHGAEQAIMQICREAGLNADKVKVKDLTAAQISRIDQEVYKNSSHPKE